MMRWSNAYPLQLRNMGHWPQWLKLLLLLLVFVIAGAVGFVMGVHPLQQQEQMMSQQAIDLRKRIQQVEQQRRLLAPVDQDLSQRGLQLSQLLAEFPTEQPVAQVVQDISTLGQQVGLTFQQIKPDTEQAKGFYAELPIRIAVVGTYAQLSAFVGGVAALPEPLVPGDFTLEATGTEGVLKMSLQVDLLRLLPTPNKEQTHAAMGSS